MSSDFNSIGRKLLSASVLRFLNLFGAAVVSLVMMPFLVHHLGDRVYGFWSLATVFVGYYSLLDAGLAGAISQHMSVAIGRKDARECRTVFNSALRIQSALGVVALLATVVIAAAAPWIGKNAADARLF
jgi:O-antigen/teichoic acid export membrane protein